MSGPDIIVISDIIVIVFVFVFLLIIVWFVKYITLDDNHDDAAQKALDPFYFGHIRVLMRKQPKYRIKINRKKKTICLKYKLTKFQLLWFEYERMHRGEIVDMSDVDVVSQFEPKISEWVDDLMAYHKEEIKVKTNSDITRVFEDVRKSKSL